MPQGSCGGFTSVRREVSEGPVALAYSASLMGPTGRALMGFCISFQFTQYFPACRDLSESLSASREVAGPGVC